MLNLMLGGLALGGVILGAALLERLQARLVLTLLLGLVAYLLLHSREAAPILFHTPGGDIVAFLAIALATLGLHCSPSRW